VHSGHPRFHRLPSRKSKKIKKIKNKKVKTNKKEFSDHLHLDTGHTISSRDIARGFLVHLLSLTSLVFGFQV